MVTALERIYFSFIPGCFRRGTVGLVKEAGEIIFEFTNLIPPGDTLLCKYLRETALK